MEVNHDQEGGSSKEPVTRKHSLERMSKVEALFEHASLCLKRPSYYLLDSLLKEVCIDTMSRSLALSSLRLSVGY